MRAPALLLALLVVALALVGGTPRSAATFTAGSSHPDNRFSAAASFSTVTASLTDPGSPLRGSVALSATASSSRGVSSVSFQRSPAGANAWSTVCVDTTAPYGCALDTTALVDGLYDLRVVATDAGGYTATSTVAGRRVDNTAPSAALTDPGSPLTGSVTLSATGSDGGAGLATLTLAYRAVGGGSWTTICTRTSSPASCTWSTAALPDGLYDLRAEAVDAAGNAGSALVSSRRVDNTNPTVTMTDPGTPLAGGVTLRSTSADGEGSGVAAVRYEYRPATGLTWSTACTATAAPFSCTWATGTLPDGPYDVRAVATDGVGLSTTSTPVTARVVDNTPPSATLVDPGSPITGTVTLTATATDATSGVVSVRFERSPAGAGTWSALCTATAAPYTCAWDTRTVADGLYDLRVVATDAAGNQRTSAVVADRRVDNDGPTVALADPGSPVRGSVTLTATASDPVGVQQVAFQHRAAGASAWTTACTDLTSPYTCALATTALADGAYELRAVATDTLGHATTTPARSVVIDNALPAAADVQGANGGIAGRIDAGDTLTLRYSEPMAPASILAGWAGAATAVTVRVTDSSTRDLIEVYNAQNTTRLALTSATRALQTQQNWVTASATFQATMVQSGTSVIVTFGSRTAGTIATGVTGTTAMAWTPSSSATDLAGNACATTAVTESGVADVDF